MPGDYLSLIFLGLRRGSRWEMVWLSVIVKLILKHTHAALN